MASVTAHVLLGSPRRYGDGLHPEFIAMFRDTALPRWQVENLDPENQRPARTVVTTTQELIALGLAVAVHAAVDSPFLNAVVDPPDDRRFDLSAMAIDKLELVGRTLADNAVALSAVVCWSQGSLFGIDHAEALVPFLTGDIEASTTVWNQIGSGHDGFGTPGERWTNPQWSGSDRP